ncbi:hypothetical protein GCM10010911_60370 [Paenibacillus nasutitermitis]|uniref:HTH araC/xylS-type domain-containing protein n=2 Tax=Paenibacillus nasutitermitis TaxID=1652958 RepID=A0A916ZG84_9BACL|nr:hypothetical protein GCM10010911_60370 [Paenibacillus nasutitermitis]
MIIETPQLELWRIEEDFFNLPHAHEDRLQITIPIKGTCFLTQENKDYGLTDGHGLLQYSAQQHSFQIGGNSGVIIIQIRNNRPGDFFRGQNIEFALQQKFDPQMITKQFQQWASELFRSDPADPLAVDETEARILSFLYYSLRGSHTLSGKELAVLRASGDQEAPEHHLARVLDYIHANYTQRISIDTLSAIALQSRFHFIRSFKAFTYMTPYQYVLGLRMEDAKKQLLHRGKTVTEVSLNVGFSSTSQFYRAFLKVVGVTPEEFRAGGR